MIRIIGNILITCQDIHDSGHLIQIGFRFIWSFSFPKTKEQKHTCQASHRSSILRSTVGSTPWYLINIRDKLLNVR